MRVFVTSTKDWRGRARVQNCDGEMGPTLLLLSGSSDLPQAFMTKASLTETT